MQMSFQETLEMLSLCLDNVMWEAGCVHTEQQGER